MSRAATCLALIAVLAAVSTVPAATITVVNLDGPGEGFNDTTPVAPVGGNTGTTLGEQRLLAFQAAADIWGSILASDVEIRIQASFNPLSCDANSGVLGQASAIQILSDFPNAPIANTWYHVALGNSIAGVDQVPGSPGTNADDISASFNSSIDNNNNCLSGTNWYLGLDNNPPGTDIDLIVVLIHEFAHGLGFSTFANRSTGGWLNGRPDVYGRLLLDNSSGLLWDQMNNAQRIASAVNTGNLVWSGPAVTAEAPNVLMGPPQLLVHSPPTLAAAYGVGTAEFGPPLSTTPVTADIVLADDGTVTTSDACEPLVNGAAMSGKIALVDRGSCTFVIKVKNAQNAGAIGAIVANNQPTGLINMGGVDATIVIPSVFITDEDGELLKFGLPGVNASLQLDPVNLAGTDVAGRVQVYAPNPLESGSSTSHWDITVIPDLLMEPGISPFLDSDVDLSDELMVDVGWTRAATGAGAVPDGAALPGTPLSVAEAGGGNLLLSWGASCAAGDDDYEVYEGTLSATGSPLVNHAPVACSTSGATSLAFTPTSGSTYYVVVPRNPAREGSYGLDSSAFERPVSFSACLPQEVLAVCP